MILILGNISSLESSLRCWEILEYLGTAMVFVGAVGESIEELTRFGRLLIRGDAVARHLRSGKIAAFMAQTNLSAVIKTVSAFILLLGLAGELLALVRTSQLSGQLIASLNERANEAYLGAAEAAKSANQVESANIKLRDGLSRATVRFKEELDAVNLAARTHEERLRQQNLESEKKLTLDKLHVLELERQTTSRRVAPGALARELTNSAGTLYEIRFLNHPECAMVSEEIQAGLQIAGWKAISNERVSIDTADFPTNVNIVLKQDPSWPSDSTISQATITAEATLIHALGRAQHIELRYEGKPTEPPYINVVLISLGWPIEGFRLILPPIR